ncbi:MAG: cation-translocating P-type ATPase [Gemmatimonadetes bacterium]|nr:cation-translocating P-type ATPase [Gemmatimonadota bacterium]
MKTIDLPVRGMDCASCAAHVRSALEQVDGVESADVLVAAEKAIVRYDEGRADLRGMADAVASAGYRVPAEALADPESAAAARQSEAEGFGRRAMAVTGLAFGAVLLVVVVGEWLGLFEAATDWVPFAVGIVIVALVGLPAFTGVLRAALRGRVISHTLMTVGVLAALAVGQWVTAAVVAFFMRVGDFVEGFTVRKGRRALRDLEAMAPATARVEADGTAREVPIAEVRVGDVVVVRPGERIPVDGVVVDGRASVEQAAITGESMPVDAARGTEVFAATIARGGALRVRTRRTGADATFGRILRMVEDAEASRGRVQSFADRFSTWYLPIVGAIALLTFVIRQDPLATAAVLVVACSCAFAIATPVAMLATIGSAARRGLLIKGGAAIEALARADVILVDKTGTFTVGRPAVHEVVSLNGASRDEVLRLAASAERDSEHPLADAIRREAARRGLALQAPTGFSAHEGSGVAATVAGAAIVVGNARAVGVEAAPSADVDRLHAEGATTAWVARDGEAIGVIALRDEVRPDVPAALAALREMGFQAIELLTGDHDAAAAPVARALGVGCRAGLLPQDKIRIVEEHQAAGRVVVMIGDGVNDAPALARADVGIAMGAAGTDLALEVAHVALMRDDWSLVPDAFRAARRTMGVVKGNFGMTGVYNVIGLTLAALGFLPPILAAAAQSIPDLGILGNSARLLRR